MLTSGENYNLTQLFSGNYRIVIPDMQRDYCWAFVKSDINGKSLVDNFIADLISYVNTQEELQMGLLYAFESPKYHIQLCDGQQRLTTLYLTLGLLYKLLPEDNLKKSVKDLLVVPKHDKASFFVPRFQYAIRESTLSFLTDLLNEFFLNEKKEVDDIKIQDWYFKEYEEDPSIQNILEALRLIDSQLNKLSSLDELTNVLLSKINFLYFDMGNRTYGEEQFVVLNTTGKPLTTTENIKPKLLGTLDDSKSENHFDNKTELQFYADMWESWEHYFWVNINSKHQTVDQGLKEFFRWVFIIESADPQKKISNKPEEYSVAQKALSSGHFNILSLDDSMPNLMQTIQSYFVIIDKLAKDNRIKSKFLFQEKPLSQIQNLEFLGLLSYLHLAECDLDDVNYITYKQYLKSKVKQDNVTKATITLAIETILIPKKLKEYKRFDIVEYNLYEESISKTLLNSCDKYKLGVLNLHKDDRREIESAFWGAENLKTNYGDIEYMFKVLNINLDGNHHQFDLLKFKSLTELIKNTFEKPTDLLIGTLLTFGHYYIHDGHTVTLWANRFALGTDAKFFQPILKGEKGGDKQIILIKFLKELLEKNILPEDLNAYFQQRLDSYSNNEHDIWSTTINSLIKDSKYLGYMSKRLFCVNYDESRAYVLNKVKASGNNSYKELIVKL